MIMLYQWLFGLIISGTVSFIACLLKLLKRSGLFVATFSGSLIILCGPWYSIFLLGAFFVSSGFIAYLSKRQLKNVEKGNTRDGWQVLANTFAPILALSLYFITRESMFLFSYVAGIAAATADTWSSEIGRLQKKKPRSILTFQQIAAGLSGGISLLGTCAAFFGAFFIGGLFFIFASIINHFQFVSLKFILFPLCLGFLGSLLDSVLGASLQVCFQCLVCKQYTEQATHHGVPTKKVKGIGWFNNDWVNFLMTSITTISAILLYHLIV